MSSNKKKQRTKQKRESDKRRRIRKQESARKLREKEAKKEAKNEIIPEVELILEVPELPEKIAVEKIVKSRATEGVIEVNFDGRAYSITIIKVSSKKVIYSINDGKEKCTILEGFKKVMRLNKESRFSMLARAV